jgi:hypothetical protein
MVYGSATDPCRCGASAARGGAAKGDRRSLEPALLYRRQFVIGPRFVDGFPAWQRLTIAGRFCVTAHPDLSTCQVSDGQSSITLLGYVLDPEHWKMSDDEILASLLRELATGRLVSALSRLGGRWVIVADTPRETLVFNDAFGMRQVYYTQGTGERWCAAQPGLLAATLGLAADDRALGALGHCASTEFWWPGPRTLYRDVARLTPNHRLDLRTGQVERYWPDEPCRPRSLADAVEACCSVAQGLFRAAHHRFRLAQTITAGWDSRLSLAASRAISPDVMYFSMRYWNMPENHRDIAVPTRLLPTLGLNHHVIRCPDVMDPAFEQLYMRNTSAAHYAYGVIAQGMHDHGLDSFMCVKSNVASIAKAGHVLPLSFAGPVRPENLLRLTWLRPSQFMLDSVDEWLTATTPRLMGFDVSELFYWEQRLGSWQAASQHEWELVVDTFDPMNCRSLMALILSVPRHLRESPTNLIHRTAIERMWPQALAAPINPENLSVRLRRVRRVVAASRPFERLRKLFR